MRVTDQDYPPPPDFNSSMDDEVRRRQQYRRQNPGGGGGMPPPDFTVDRSAPPPPKPSVASRAAGAIRSASSAVGRNAGPISTGLAAAAEGVGVADVIRDPNASKGDVAVRAAEGGARLGGAWLGAKAGAAVGSFGGPAGAIIGGAAGGALGYAGADKLLDLASSEWLPGSGKEATQSPGNQGTSTQQVKPGATRSPDNIPTIQELPAEYSPSVMLHKQAKDSNDISQLNLGPNSGVIKGQTSGRTMVVRDGMVMGDGMKDPRAMGDISTLDSSAVWKNKPYFDQLRAERQARESRGPRVVQLGADDAARTERRNLALGSREERGVARWMSNQAIQNRAIDAELQGIDSLDNFRMGQLEAEAIRSTGQARRDDIAASLDMARLDQLNQQSTLANQLRAETDPARRQAMQDELLVMQGKSPEEGRMLKFSKDTDAFLDQRTGQTIDPAAQQQQKKTATMKEVEETAKARGLSVGQVIAQLEKEQVQVVK